MEVYNSVIVFKELLYLHTSFSLKYILFEFIQNITMRKSPNFVIKHVFPYVNTIVVQEVNNRDLSPEVDGVACGCYQTSGITQTKGYGRT